MDPFIVLVVRELIARLLPVRVLAVMVLPLRVLVVRVLTVIELTTMVDPWIPLVDTIRPCRCTVRTGNINISWRNRYTRSGDGDRTQKSEIVNRRHSNDP